MTTPPLNSRNLLDRPPGVQCTARSKRTGKRCQRPAMLGGNVCRAHGGAAPQTRAAAKRRIDQAADVLVQRLLSFALDGEVADPVALAAIRDALDRAGLNPKTAVEVEVKPWQDILGGITGVARISREDSHARRGVPDARPALPAADSAEPIDAEVVREPAETPSAADSRPGIPHWAGEQPGRSLMTLEEAAAEQAADRARIHSARRVRSRRV